MVVSHASQRLRLFVIAALTESRINFLLKQKFIPQLIEKWQHDRSVPKALISLTSRPSSGGNALVQYDSNQLLQLKNKATHIIRELAKFDPSPSFDYILWICREYSKDHIRLFEDLGSRIHLALVKYNRMRLNGKLLPNQRDILQYTAFQVEDLTTEFVVIPDAKEKELKFYEDKEATVLYNDSQIKVIIPHTKAASIFFGINTKWCISASESENAFESYNKDGRLYFITIKKDNKRFAIHFKRNEFQNENEYGINEIADVNSIRIINAQIADIKHLTSSYPVLYKIFEPIALENLKTWFSLLFIKNPTEEMVLKAIKRNAAAYLTISNPSEEFTLKALRINGNIIKYIDKLTEAVQLAAVKHNGYDIAYIIEAGITPSEAVQLAVVTQNGNDIKYIIYSGITPSEAVQLAAVTQNGYAIIYIIGAGIVLSEAVQLAAVKQDGEAIEHIIKAGIVPSEALQLAAVTQNGHAILHIIDARIIPSEAVQLAAVTENGSAIEHIIKASIIPSEETQLIAVTQSEYNFFYIKRAGIKPTVKVRALQKKLWGGDNDG